MGTGKRRKAAQIARDRRRIANLYLQGWLQVDIAAEVNLSGPTVCRDLKALHKEWIASALIDIDAAKSKELARIDRLEREYWTAWWRSIEDAETTTKKAVETATETRKEAVQTAKGQSGDPRFLQGVQWCIERRCKILGIDAPKEHIVTWRERAKAEGYDPDAMLHSLSEQFKQHMVEVEETVE